MTTSKADALNQVKRLTGSENDIDIDIWLEDSAGYTSLAIKIYRPYYVCALELWLRAENNLTKGEGAEFQQNYETTRRFLNMQLNLDVQQELSVPVAYLVNTFLTQLQSHKTSSSILAF